MKDIFCGNRDAVRVGVIMLCVLCFPLLWVSRSFASDFQVQPTTIELSAKVKSGVFSVVNNGNEKIDFQVSLQEWNQDEKGKDVLTETNDIVFFPKIMSVEPNSQRAVRIGLKVLPSTKEKTYRLFVQEIPTPKNQQDIEVKDKNIKAGVTIAFRFSMPIFVKPLKPQESCVFDSIEMSKGVVKAVVKNTGNVHIKTRAVKFIGKDAEGKEIFSKEIAGWYILNGLSFPYEAEIPKDICGKVAKVDISAQTENNSIFGNLNVQKSMCAQ
jgi:fimbrial chaperone protein